mgnify:CR=1 FL=1
MQTLRAPAQASGWRRDRLFLSQTASMACRVRQEKSAIGLRVQTAAEAGGEHRHTDLSDADWRAVRHAVLVYVRRRGHSQDVAEDVAQESLTKLLHYTRQGQTASLYALAFKIAANSLVDRFRGDSRYGAAILETHPCGEPLPDKVTSDRQRLARLSAALERLPPLRRAVLLRRRMDNQSIARIAAEMNLSPAAVEKHVVRGLSDLRKAMEDGEELKGSSRDAQ